MGLPREQRIRKTDEFKRVFAKGRRAADGLLAVTAMPGEGEGPRFGLSVGKRLGPATVRNRLKRQLREILRTQRVTESWNIVVTARQGAVGARRPDLRVSAEGLLARLGITPAGSHGNRTTVL